MVSCGEGPENLVGRLGVEEVPADSGREIDRLANEVEETDDVGLSGTVWSHDGVRTTFEVKIERIESQKILDVQGLYEHCVPACASPEVSRLVIF
jgi:hypothetical protein